jgi:hypothetical protein
MNQPENNTHLYTNEAYSNETTEARTDDDDHQAPRRVRFEIDEISGENSAKQSVIENLGRVIVNSRQKISNFVSQVNLIFEKKIFPKTFTFSNILSNLSSQKLANGSRSPF